METLTQTFCQLFGDSLASTAINRVQFLAREPACLSVADMYFNPRKQAALAQQGIHAYLAHPGQVAMDSGGYQNLREHLKAEAVRAKGEEPRPVKDFTVEEMVQIYRACHFQRGDLAVGLDYPPTPLVPLTGQIHLPCQSRLQLLEMSTIISIGVLAS